VREMESWHCGKGTSNGSPATTVGGDRPAVLQGLGKQSLYTLPTRCEFELSQTGRKKMGYGTEHSVTASETDLLTRRGC
jgi:hypothetical protein